MISIYFEPFYLFFIVWHVSVYIIPVMMGIIIIIIAAHEVTLVHNVYSFAKKSLANQKAITLDFMSYVLIQFGIIESRSGLSTHDITPICSLDKNGFTLTFAPLAIYALCNSSAERSDPYWSCRTHHKTL